MIKRLLQMFFKQKTSETKIVEAKTYKPLEDFLKSDLLSIYIASQNVKTTLLKPHYSESQISFGKSKMGGIPNLNHFDEYPICKHCNTALIFILQIYKEEYPEFYFENEDNLFQLFRCPNHECKGIEYEKYDLTMYHYFFNSDSSKQNKELAIPERIGDDLEEQPHDCEFLPERITDLPNYDETESDIYTIAEKEYGEDAENELFENYSAKVGTKIGGFPAWTQSPNYPWCKCGKRKEFYFNFRVMK